MASCAPCGGRSWRPGLRGDDQGELRSAAVAVRCLLEQEWTGTINDINEGNKTMLESMLGEPDNLAVITNGMAELAEATSADCAR